MLTVSMMKECQQEDCFFHTPLEKFPIGKTQVRLERIRDCIAFPKNNSGRDVMIDAPAPLEQAQLDELNILVDLKEK